MPKQTFFNLPDMKRHTLMRAVETEFSRTSLHEASIANIVKLADIPRGSFYQYFADKEDAFYFLLENVFKSRRAMFVSLLKQHDGDLIEAISGFFQQVLMRDDHLDFVRNALLYMTYQIRDVMTKVFWEQINHGDMKQVSSLIDTQKLNMADERELFHIVQILTSVLIRNLVDAFARHLSYETAMEHLTVELNLLRTGIYQ